MLAELVKAGKLPPVEQRVPEEPLVIKPLHEIGKYGGTWRRAFTGPATARTATGSCRPTSWCSGTTRASSRSRRVAKSWEVSDGGRTITFSLRKGHKWSDGAAVHGRRHHVLVRGHVPEQGADPDADRRHVDQRQARHDREGRRAHRPLQVPGAVPVLPRGDRRQHLHRLVAEPGRRHRAARAATRPSTTSSSSTRSTPARTRSTSWPRTPSSTTGRTYFKFKSELARSTRTPGRWRPGRPTRRSTRPNWVLERNPFYYAVDTDGNQLPVHRQDHR